MASANKLSNEQKIKLLLVAFIVSILGLTMLYLLTIDKPLDEDYKPVYEYGGDFVLQNHTGDVALADYRDKVVVLYFGFLNCTEACPISIGTIYNAIGKLSPDEREKLQVFFVSVDPERDDIDKLKAFSDFYQDRFKDTSNPTILSAITGTRANVDAVSKLYGVYFDLVDLESSGLGYTVDHSSRFYMIGGDGKLLTTMNHSTTPTELAAKIQQMQQDYTAQQQSHPEFMNTEHHNHEQLSAKPNSEIMKQADMMDNHQTDSIDSTNQLSIEHL